MKKKTCVDHPEKHKVIKGFHSNYKVGALQIQTTMTDTFVFSSNSLEERQRPWILAPTMQAWLGGPFLEHKKGWKKRVDHDLKEGPEKKNGWSVVCE